MADYETERAANIKQNQALLKSLGLSHGRQDSKPARPAPSKKRKFTALEARPTRSSARLASVPKRNYNSPSPEAPDRSRSVPIKREPRATRQKENDHEVTPEIILTLAISDLIVSWPSWAPSAPEPDQDDTGTFHFDSHPSFLPNKSPAEILREGAFGGTYFRPLYSQKLRTTIRDDYIDTIPEEWREGLNLERSLLSDEYDPQVNKFGVACRQSIEEWEKAGWIRHEWDVRGWFQWYCRFFRGRRCEDDERQVGRWERCVGPKGRWKRALLKKYIKAGVRNVMDEEADEDEDGGPRLSPLVHQTCHHWAFEIRQEVLDEAWEEADLGR